MFFFYCGSKSVGFYLSVILFVGFKRVVVGMFGGYMLDRLLRKVVLDSCFLEEKSFVIG